MANARPGPNDLQVGPPEIGAMFRNIRIISTALTPGAVSLSVASQAFTITPISTLHDNVIMISWPAQSSLNVLPMAAEAGPGDNQVTISYSAASGTAATPNAGTYRFLIFSTA